MQEISEKQLQSLGREDPLEEGLATHSSILAWRIPMDRGAWWATVHSVAKSWIRLKRLSTDAHRKFKSSVKGMNAMILSHAGVVYTEGNRLSLPPRSFFLSLSLLSVSFAK